MSDSTQMGEWGVDEPIEREIRRTFPSYPESTIRQMFSDPSVALLAALLREQRGDVSIDDENSRQTSRYYADVVTVTTSGPDDQSPENIQGKRVDAGFVVDSWDLRFDDDVLVAFKPPNRTHREIKYRAQDSPVVGIPADSRYIWVERPDSAGSNPLLRMEGYVDGS